MLYVLKAIDYGEVYEYEYGNLRHAMEHYDKEKTAMVLEYNNGVAKILVSKICGEDLTIQN